MISTVLSASAWQEMFARLPWLFPLTAALVGTILASFSGVLVDRLPRAAGLHTGVPDRSVNLLSPSRCPHCGVRLSALALIPVIGWLVYRGRCFRCGVSVPCAYPAMEAVSAVLSAAFALRFGPTESGLWALALLWGSIAMSWMDWREHWIPDSISVPLLLAGLVASPFQHSVLWRNEALVLCWALLWVISMAVGAQKQVDAVSGGDLVLAGLGGAWLGLPLAVPFLLISAIIYIAYALPLQILNGRVGAEPPPEAPPDELEDVPYSGPMGPALCAGLMVCIWFGPAISLAVPAWLNR